MQSAMPLLYWQMLASLITASSTRALLWARQIIERLEVFQPDTLEAWYNYFSSGKEQDFFALMQTLCFGGNKEDATMRLRIDRYLSKKSCPPQRQTPPRLAKIVD